MRPLHIAAMFSLCSLLLACTTSSDDTATDEASEDLSGNPAAISIGFDGPNDQWSYYPDFQKADTNKGLRLCHTYVEYGVGTKPAQMGDGGSPEGSRAYLEFWLKNAQAHCDEALIGLKAQSHHSPPSVSDYKTAVQGFANTNWKALTGFTGKIAVTQWNEPNNPGDAGNGLGVKIPADTAARYFMTLAKACEGGKCIAIAGDFATNGDMWTALSWNCQDDNVTEGQLCKVKSSANTDGSGASYLDVFKNTIQNEVTKFGLPAGYRPPVMAYHGWHDENEYLKDSSNLCKTYGDCAVRRLVRSMGGSWGAVEIWDTEDGITQDIATTPGNEEFGRGAAFMLCLHAKVSHRITRIYYTRLHRGSGQLMNGHALRGGAEVLAKHETSSGTFKCNE